LVILGLEDLEKKELQAELHRCPGRIQAREPSTDSGEMLERGKQNSAGKE